MSATSTATLEPSATTSKTDTGLTDGSHGSSSSAERYDLDEFDDHPVLLYKYRGRLETSSQKHLCALLDKDEGLRVTKKKIPAYTSYVDVRRHDLFLPDEKELYHRLPNYDSALASIKVPMLAYLSRLIFGTYETLYIVSPETSPASSVASTFDSRRSSPTMTWDRSSTADARLGAKQDPVAASG